MTYVGKILVVVIMFFAIIFLAFSVVVFNTEMNWKDQVAKLGTEVQNLKGEKSRLEADVSTQKSTVQSSQGELKAFQAKAAAELKGIQDENKRWQDEITKQRTLADTAVQQVKVAQDEAEARISEATVLRDNLAKVQTQRDEFKLQKTDLDQQILLLKRELEVAMNNNKNLRDRVAIYAISMKAAGLSTDVEELQVRGGQSPPPQVEGEVVKVSPNNQSVEISLGSNDGLKVGHELLLYSVNPSPEYLGKIRITATDVQQSVGRVIGGKTILGKKIKEGDHVTTKISRG